MAIRWRLAHRIADLDAGTWDALVPDGNPFVRHAFLSALELGGSLRPELGWRSRPLLLEDDGRLLAALPAYEKQNSHGEFVFDWHWAEASHRAGIPYYPKLLIGAPYSPVPGPRLLLAPECRDDSAYYYSLIRETLRAWIDGETATRTAKARQLPRYSGIHINFHLDTERSHDPDWIERLDWQYHWFNPGYRDFDDFLDTLIGKKRKNIRQERERVARQGWTFRRVPGTEATEAELDLLYRCYVQTFLDKGNTPALTRETFACWLAARELGAVLVVAELECIPRAMAFLFANDQRLYGRYWGSEIDAPGLHFETCYYQGIEYAIAHKLKVFEPGAQGEHKLARGFVPVPTWSSHWLAHPGLRHAVAGHVAEETKAQVEFGAVLRRHSPYRDHQTEAPPA